MKKPLPMAAAQNRDSTFGVTYRAATTGSGAVIKA